MFKVWRMFFTSSVTLQISSHLLTDYYYNVRKVIIFTPYYTFLCKKSKKSAETFSRKSEIRTFATYDKSLEAHIAPFADFCRRTNFSKALWR